MGCHAQYLSGELAEGGAFATQEQAELRVVITLHVIYAFYQYYWLLFSSLFVILLKRSHPNPRVFAFFLLILLPISPVRRKEWESNCVVLCCKLRQNDNNRFINCLHKRLRLYTVYKHYTNSVKIPLYYFLILATIIKQRTKTYKRKNFDS